MARELCLIATIIGPHGIRGGVRLYSHSDIPGRFLKLKSVLVGDSEKDVLEMRIKRVSEDFPRVLLEFNDCNDRDMAEALVGKQIFIPDEEMEAPPEGKYFVHDLIGCSVQTLEGEKRGRLKDVMLMPANDIYIVEYWGSEVLIPAGPAFIHSVDTALKLIVIKDVPGLFEVNNED